MSSRKSIRKSVTQFISSKALAMKLMATLLVVLAFGLAVARISRHQQAALQVTASAIEGDRSFYRFNIGEQLIYKLDYANTSVSDFQKLFAEKDSSGKEQKTAPSGLAHSFNTRVQGELMVTVLDNQNDTRLVAFRVRNPVVSINANGQAATTEAETVKMDLSRDIFAQLDLSGRVLAVRFDPSANSLSQSFARALLATTQLVFPGTPMSDLKQWEAQEDDTTGPYIARYEAQPGTGNCGAKDALAVKMFRKTKARYLKSPAKTNAGELDISTTINPGGHLMAGFDFNQGRVICLNGKESQTIVMAGKTVAQAETTIGLNYLSKESLSATELSAMRKASLEREKTAASVPLSARASEEESEASIHRTELGEATIESLLAELAELEMSADETKDETTLYLKFKALVYLQPQSSSLLGELLSTSHPGSATARILTGALGAVGHREAQSGLVSAIESRLEDWPALATLIPVLGSVSLPTPLAEDTLQRLASNSADWNIASTAQLALGVMARTLAEQSPERAAKIVDWAINNLESSSSTELAKQWLLVLGNTGSTTALPGIARFSNDSSPELRAIAAAALRFIKTSQVDELLSKILASDSDARVRLEAAVALGFREMNAGSLAAQKQAFLKDKAVNVRLAVLKNLWQSHEAFPEIRQLVKQSAARDASKEVRKAATEITSNYSKDSFKQVRSR